MGKAQVTARVEGKDWALGEVRITNAERADWVAEERVLFGRIALESCLPRAQRYWAGLMAEQAIYLETLKAVCRALVDGPRDQALERDVSTAFMRHNGIAACLTPDSPLREVAAAIGRE
jgi:hypothetical protein